MLHCDGKNNQLWYLEPNGLVKAAALPDRCLDADTVTKGHTSYVKTKKCNARETNQRWRLSTSGFMYLDFQPSLCLDVGENGTHTVLMPCGRQTMTLVMVKADNSSSLPSFPGSSRIQPIPCARNCMSAMLSDGTCDEACNVEACGFDGGDCDGASGTSPDDVVEAGSLPQASTREPAASMPILGDSPSKAEAPETSTLPDFLCAPGCVERWIGDGDCDEKCNTEACRFDNGDCIDTSGAAEAAISETTALEMLGSDDAECAPGCLIRNVGDLFCDEDCNNAQCNSDGGDCEEECSWNCLDRWLGDGFCDDECNNAECNYDRGDCVGVPASDGDSSDSTRLTYGSAAGPCAPGCDDRALGDLFCDEECNSANCFFDFGDCAPFRQRCAANCQDRWMGDGFCDEECNSAECSWDDGDCEPPTQDSSDSVGAAIGPLPEGPCAPGCDHRTLADDFCDDQCNVATCYFDGGDCAPMRGNCARHCQDRWMGDGFCDEECNIAACNWDDGDCEPFPVAGSFDLAGGPRPLPEGVDCADGCQALMVGNSVCNQACNVPACNFDMGDCARECAPNCFGLWLGDGFCDEECKNLACEWDEGDCAEELVAAGSAGEVQDEQGSIPSDSDPLAYGVAVGRSVSGAT